MPPRFEGAGCRTCAAGRAPRPASTGPAGRGLTGLRVVSYRSRDGLAETGGGPGDPVIGQSPRRREDERLLTGRGRFIDDVAPPGLTHLALVRSTHARAGIAGIDAASA